MKRMFDFDPTQYTAAFRAQGYVHIPEGLSEEFYETLSKQVDEYLQVELLKQFAVGDKQQALYEFPNDADYVDRLFEAVGAVCGLDPRKLVLSERHVKTYESDADPNPPAHKDRFSTEISVGFSVDAARGSSLVLYPHDYWDANPFSSSTALRTSLSPDRLPENILKTAKRVEIADSERDVIIFLGRNIWHLRSNAAGTKMLYLKLNSFNCDLLGEDPYSVLYRKRTENLLSLEDSALEKMIPLMGRKVDFIERRYTRDWEEDLGVVLWGEPPFTIDQEELLMLKAIDGQRTVGSVIEKIGYMTNGAAGLRKIRRLAARGILDMLGNGG